MGNPKSPKQLEKFLGYVLGRRPDEFGLVPDENGFVKIKELLQALSEEEGWRHVRKAHIKELFLTLEQPNIEVQDKLIRAVQRESRQYANPPEKLPKLLYVCVRKKSYGHVIEKGIYPTQHPQIILATESGLAVRIGKRRDPSPVALTVNVAQAVELGVAFYQVAESLFLAEFLPAGCFTGPPLPKEKPEIKKAAPREKELPKEPGSYFVNMDQFEKSDKSKHKKKGPDWKKDRKRIRKEKENLW